MGTNYYLKRNICNECGRYDELHVGKSSAGWRFIFRRYDDVRNVEDWKQLMKENEFWNEYGEKVEYEWFWELVHNKQSGRIHHYDSELIDGFVFCDNEFS